MDEKDFYGLKENVAILTEQMKTQSEQFKSQQRLIERQSKDMDGIKQDINNININMNVMLTKNKEEIISSIKELYGDPVVQYNSLKKKTFETAWDFGKKAIAIVLSFAIMGATYYVIRTTNDMKAEMQQIVNENK